jgi:hypothetical protein
MFAVIIRNNLLCEVRYYYNSVFGSSVKCPLIIVNSKQGNDKEPTTKCGMLDNGKTSNFKYNTVVTRWKSGKMIGPSSVGLFLLDSIFCPRNERAAFQVNWCYFGSPVISSLEFSCGGTFGYPLEVCLYVPKDSSRSGISCPSPHVHCPLNQIKFLPFNLYHRFFQRALSTPRPRPSLSRRPGRLRWCWCVYWIVSRRAFSNEIVNTNVAVFFRSC